MAYVQVLKQQKTCLQKGGDVDTLLLFKLKDMAGEQQAHRPGRLPLGKRPSSAKGGGVHGFSVRLVDERLRSSTARRGFVQGGKHCTLCTRARPPRPP